MHELTVTQNILETSLRHAQNANAKKITNIKIVIGQFASIIDDSIIFYWDLISKETIAKGSCLEFKRIPANFRCRDCEEFFSWNDDIFACPHCNSDKIIIQTGTEFYIESIEIE